MDIDRNSKFWLEMADGLNGLEERGTSPTDAAALLSIPMDGWPEGFQANNEEDDLAADLKVELALMTWLAGEIVANPRRPYLMAVYRKVAGSVSEDLA